MTCSRWAVFLLAGSALIYQLAQTRLFSAGLGYHLTFVAVSVALLGVGAAGTAEAVLGSRAPTSARIATLATGSYLLALLVHLVLDPAALPTGLVVLTTYIVGGLPYLFTSWVIVRVIASSGADAGRTYAFDLAGAALGGIAAYAVLPQVGAPALMVLAAGAAALAAGMLGHVGRPLALIVVTALASLLVIRGDVLPVRAVPEKPIHLDLRGGGRVEATRWDPHARVDVVTFERGSQAAYDFLVPPSYTGPRPPVRVVRLDLDAATDIVSGGLTADLAAFDASILAAPYHIAERDRVLVIGPGGGTDLLIALRGGAERVTAVEVNGAVVALMRGEYLAASGHLYADPRVSVITDEARSFVRRSNEQYDTIAMTVVDSWAALASGTYGLSETYLYTEEAFRDYLARLTPSGVLAIGRWYRDGAEEMARTAAVALGALQQRAAEEREDALQRMLRDDPGSFIVVLRDRTFGLLMVKRTPWTAAELRTLRGLADRHGYGVAYAPDVRSSDFVQALHRESTAVVTDDRPFFFDVGTHASDTAGAGRRTLTAALATATILALGLVVYPVLRRLRGCRGEATAWTVAGAVTVGLGFISAEMVLLQRLTLYLGQPALALVVGLSALLLGAAAGAALVRRTGVSFAQACAVAGFGAGMGLMLLPRVIAATLAAPAEMRMLVAIGASVLIGAALGAPFPRLLSQVATIDTRLTAAAWAVNGAASVIGAIAATMLAMSVGFSALAVLPTAVYLAASVALRRAPM